MADFCDSFENWVRSRTRITDLIGSGAACRVYPDVQNQGIPLPFLVYAESGGESEEHLTGAAGICMTALNVWSFGATRRKANELAEIVKEELRPLRGSMGGTLVSEVSVSGHREYGIDQTQDSQPLPRYWTRRIFNVWHSETT